MGSSIENLGNWPEWLLTSSIPDLKFEHFIFYSDEERTKKLKKPYNTCSIRKAYAEIDPKDPNKQSIGTLFGLWVGNNNALTWLDPKNDFNTPEGQDYSWETLIKNKQIWTKGLIKTSKGKKVYIIKTDLNNDKVKYTLTDGEISSPNFTKYDYPFNRNCFFDEYSSF